MADLWKEYAFPNDEPELDRMDLENHLFTLLFDGELYFAPLQSPLRILDLGTGTGIWAIDVADKYPAAYVVATDLSPVQPVYVPPNVEFQIDDVEQEWSFQEDFFNLIHWRLMLASISDYPALFEKAFRHIKPGGYIEIHDLDPGFYCDDGTVPEDCASVQWATLFKEACARMGRPIPSFETYRKGLSDAGFVDIQERIFKRPSNTWPKDRRLKEIGMFTCANMLDGYEGFTLGPFSRALGWSKLEVDILLAKSKAEWKDRSIHGYQKVIAIWGQKPY